VRKAALRVALSDKLREEQMLVLRDFGLTEIKTKVALEVLNNLESTNTLVVTGSANEMLEKSLRNLPKVKLLKADGLNVYDILKYDRLLLMEDAVQPIEEALA
jgi:large subunit ribosomal protein L4